MKDPLGLRAMRCRLADLAPTRDLFGTQSSDGRIAILHAPFCSSENWESQPRRWSAEMRLRFGAPQDAGGGESDRGEEKIADEGGEEEGPSESGKCGGVQAGNEAGSKPRQQNQITAEDAGQEKAAVRDPAKVMRNEETAHP